MSTSFPCRLHNATLRGELPAKLTITHPGRPEKGKAFEFVRFWGSKVILRTDDGREFRLLANWTDYQTQPEQFGSTSIVLSIEGLREMLALCGPQSNSHKTIKRNASS